MAENIQAHMLMNKKGLEQFQSTVISSNYEQSRTEVLSLLKRHSDIIISTIAGLNKDERNDYLIAYDKHCKDYLRKMKQTSD